MKNILFLLVLITGFLTSAAVQTQLANKVVIGSSISSTDKTLEFNNNLGSANPKIKLNSTASKIQYSNDGTTYRDLGVSDSYYGVSLLNNGGFENGISDGWTSTMVFQEAQASDVIYQKKSAVVQTATSGYLETSAVALPKYLYGARCLARVSYMTTGSANGMQLTVLDSAGASVTGGISSNFFGVASSSKKDVLLYFTCPTSGSIKLRVTATLAIIYDVILDEAFLGALTISDYKLPTVQRFTGTGPGSYVAPSGVRYIKVKMVGGGAGGTGSATAAAANGGVGGAGGNTTFGTSLLTANGAPSGSTQTIAGAGGSVTVNSPAISLIALAGASGQSGTSINFPTAASGQSGAVSFFGGAGAGVYNAAGGSALANSGSGGAGGGGTNGAANYFIAPSGGAGGYVEAIINNPSSSYDFSVGTGGTGGAAGTSGNAGGAGGSGVIIVEEYY